MHLIIGFLGSVVTILYLLHRLAEMGIDLGGLNPFLWRRRRKWTKLYHANPIFQIDNPMESTALLLTAVAKADGELSIEEKKKLLALFEQEFELSANDASGLLNASGHLLGRGDEVRENMQAVLEPSIEHFTTSQLKTTLGMLKEVAEADGPASEIQQNLVDQATMILGSAAAPKGKWE